MTVQEQNNVRNILRLAQRHLIKAKQDASPEQAIFIANREAQVEAYFRERGVETKEGIVMTYKKRVSLLRLGTPRELT